MAAATAFIDTPERNAQQLVYPLAANTVIFGGTIVAIDAAGNAKPAADVAALKVCGVAQESVDNTGGAAGDKSIVIKRGAFKFANSAADALDADDKFKTCFIEDDNTVREAGGTNSIKAGLVLLVEPDGVWVDFAITPAL